MFNHAPSDYRCPFCDLLSGIKGDHVFTQPEDIIYQNQNITSFIASNWWPTNPGHVLIIPNIHVENIYSLSSEISLGILDFAKHIATGIKQTYVCDGITLHQNNEPAGNQVVWHFHLHVFPRYSGDKFNPYIDPNPTSDPKDRLPYANKLRDYISANPYQH